MGYRARPRYEARIQRPDNTPPPDRQLALSLAPRPEGPREPQVVLDALNEMHNEAPRRHA